MPAPAMEVDKITDHHDSKVTPSALSSTKHVNTESTSSNIPNELVEEEKKEEDTIVDLTVLKNIESTVPRKSKQHDSMTLIKVRRRSVKQQPRTGFMSLFDKLRMK